jgi:glycogen debranching enzyme
MSDLTSLKIYDTHGSRSNCNPMANNSQHILANAERTSDRVRSLKHRDTFAVFDHYGDICPVLTGEDGLYYDGTRFLCGFVMDLNCATPLLLGSTVRDDNGQFIVNLTNSDLFRDGKLYLPANSIHISRKIFLFDAALYAEIKLENYAFEATE